MYKKLLATSLVAASVLFVGCGSSDSTCRIDVQKALDSGDFNTAISKLDGECAATFSPSDKDLNLATAYMGKAGYSVSDIVKNMLVANDNSNDAFATFVSSMSATKQTNSSQYLQKSQDYFLESVKTNSADTLKTLCAAANLATNTNTRLDNVCLYYGMNQTATTVDTISYLTNDVNKTIDSITNNTNTTPDDMKASLDALSWATNTSPLPSNVTNDRTVTLGTTSYKSLSVTENGKTFYRLADATAPSSTASTVLTDGYCAADGNKTACATIENTDGSIDLTNSAAVTCYACPVGLDTNTSSNVVEVLVDAINNGTDSIAAVTNDPDIQQSVQDLKVKIDTNNDGVITSDEIIAYLNK